MKYYNKNITEKKKVLPSAVVMYYEKFSIK